MEFDDDIIDDDNVNNHIEFPPEVQNAIEQVIQWLVGFMFNFQLLMRMNSK